MMMKSVVAIGCCLALLSATAQQARPLAGTKAMPSQQALDRELQQVEEQRRRVFSDPSLDSPENNFPKIDAPAMGGVDVEAVAQRYSARGDASKSDALMVFASLSMPMESFKQLLAATARVGGTVMLRGFKDGSYQKTAAFIQQLGEASGSLQINPKAFDQYKVDQVPVVVIARADSFERIDLEGCSLPETYAAVAGDVSLDFALEHIMTRAPEFNNLAAGYLRHLRGGVR